MNGEWSNQAYTSLILFDLLVIQTSAFNFKPPAFKLKPSTIILQHTAFRLFFQVFVKSFLPSAFWLNPIHNDI